MQTVIVEVNESSREQPRPPKKVPPPPTNAINRLSISR